MLTQMLAAPMLLGLAVAPLAAGLFAALFGLCIVRLSGVYVAMLTLAFAQIVWGVAFQWGAVTGGGNRMLRIWREGWARGPRELHWPALGLVGGHRTPAGRGLASAVAR